MYFSRLSGIYISLTAETAGEICLCDVVVDGENIPVAEACVVENSGWLYREQWDNFMIWPEEDGIENRLTLHFWANEVHLGFSYTPYAGGVTITSSTEKDGGTWDLHCPEWKEGDAVQYADFSFDSHYTYSSLALLLYGTGLLPLISLVCLILFYAADLVWKKSLLIIDFLFSNHILMYLIIILISFLSWIQLELSSTFENWIDVFTINAKYIALNIMTVCTVYLFIHSIVNSLWKSCVIFSIFITLLSVVNYYVIEFHGTPLTFMELQNFKTALNVIGGYKFDIKGIDEIIYIFCVEIILCYIVKKTDIKVQGKRILRRRLIKDFCLYSIVFWIIFFTYLSPNPFMEEKVAGAWASSYHQYGYAACTVKLAVESANFLQKPDGYENGIDNIEFVNIEHDSTENKRPDIILILNETFYDLSLISNIETDVPYLENIDILENTIRGYAVVPNIGGNTNWCTTRQVDNENI